jgi:hypothetical protein
MIISFEHFYVNLNIIIKSCIGGSLMKENDYDKCKMQYYHPEPITGARLAHAYVPFQCLMCLYPPETGLERGTIFPELDRPYGSEAEYTADA